MASNTDEYPIADAAPKFIKESSPAPGPIELAINSINQALANKNFDQAECLIQEFWKFNPSIETSLKLAHILFVEKKYVKAEQVYKDLLPKVTETQKAEVLFGLGQVYFKTKMFSDSHMVFTIITNSFPDYKFNYFIYLKLARIMINFKDFTNASKYLDKIFESKDVNYKLLGEAMIYLAFIKEKEGKLEESLQILKKSVTLCKSFRIVASFVYTLVTVKPDMANRVCSNILKKSQNPSDWSDFCFIQALANIKLNNLAKAKQLLEEQVQSFPLNYLYSEYLAVVYLKNKENLKALEMLQKLRSLFPFDICNLKNLAMAYLRIGLKTEAFHVLNAAASILNKESMAFKNLKITEPYLDILSFPTNSC